MSRKNGCIFAISMLIFGGFSPVVAVAEPVDVSNLDTAALRALFHGPAFSVACPLVVYGEDYSSTAATRRAALVPSGTHANPPSRPAASIIREMLRSPDFASPDGLDDYGDEFASAQLSRMIEPSN
jgi:hypothetical protein